MTAAESELLDEFVDDYRALTESSGGVDEFVTPEGVRPGSEPLADALRAGGLTRLLTALRDVERFTDDDGITYGSHGPDEPGDPWLIDPLPVMLTGEEWARMEAGLAQRAALLHQVFDDLYGPRRLIHDGILPASLVLGHEGFIRPAHGIRPEWRRLVQTATDLARDRDGNWVVLSDRTQAPSGAGYAMATRRIVTKALPRLHRATDLARLRPFFDTVTAATHAAAPWKDDTPHVVVLTPGSNCETAYDQAFSASLLGFPLVEADDLVMREGRVWLRTRDRFDQVDVILRRVDELFADPLDLRGDSQLGLPGLVEANRNGHVALANPIGSGLLENPALHAYMPQLSHALLGEDPLLPSAQTWWCGDVASRSYVLANLDSLVIKPISRGVGQAVAGWSLDRATLDEYRRRIEAEPWAWVGQHAVQTSTAPTVTRHGLEARPFVLRTFGVHHRGNYEVLPGGLGRVSDGREDFPVTMFHGAIAKDVWILSSTDPANRPWLTLPTADERTSVAPRGGHDPALTPRVADNLFWFGRYCERTESTTRLLMVADDLAEDHGSRAGTPGERAMQGVFSALDALTLVGPRLPDESAVEYLRNAVLDPDRRGTIATCSRRLVHAAQQVREIVSGDTWAVLASLERVIEDIPPDEDQLQPRLERVLERLLALAGIAAHGMVRDATWAFVNVGVRLERAQSTTNLLRIALAADLAPNVESLITEAVLRVGDSTLTHRRRTAMGTGPSDQVESTLDLLLADRQNPRSVGYQLDRLVEGFALIGDPALVTQAALVNQRLSELDFAELTEDRAALGMALSGVRDELFQLNDAIQSAHFVRQPSRQQAPGTQWSNPWQVA